MPTKRTPINRATRCRISPRAVAAFKAKDEVELHCALGLKPFEASPLDAGPRTECPWSEGTAGFANLGTGSGAACCARAANHGRGAAKRKGAGMKIIDMEGLLVRLVDNLVSTSASEVSEGDEVLKTQAHFYRVLIANCERKAEMAEELAEKFGRDDAS